MPPRRAVVSVDPRDALMTGKTGETGKPGETDKKRRALPIAPSSAPPRLDAEGLFRAVFEPLYPLGADLAAIRATDANPARNPQIAAQLDETVRVFAKLAPAARGAPARARARSDASVHRLAPLLTLETREQLLAARDERGTPLLAQVVIHGAIYVGACIVARHGGEWLARSPLWESLVRLESRAGVAEISPFSWWLRSLSDDEIGRSTLLERYRIHVELPTFDPESLEPIAEGERRIPRLEKVRYDLLYKLLKAHLPELRDVGADFPSPERFDELGFRWLGFELVGGGRVLVVHGPTARGVVAMFLSKQGFLKQHYYERDGLVGHRVESRGDRVRVVLEHRTADGGSGEDVHETFFWGG
jgi:hypothetical protein